METGGSKGQFCIQDAFSGSIGTKLGMKGRLVVHCLDAWSILGELDASNNDQREVKSSVDPNVTTSLDKNCGCLPW